MKIVCKYFLLFISMHIFLVGSVSHSFADISRYNIRHIELRYIAFHDTSTIGDKFVREHQMLKKFIGSDRNAWRNSIYENYFKRYIVNILSDKGYTVSVGPDLSRGPINLDGSTASGLYVPVDQILQKTSHPNVDAILVFTIIRPYTNIDLGDRSIDRVALLKITVGWFLYSVPLKRVIVNESVHHRNFFETRKHSYQSGFLTLYEDMDTYCKRFMESPIVLGKIPPVK